jgi:hypothetical protein
VKAISVDDTVRGLGRPLLNMREMLVTTPTILVKQDETDESARPALMVARSTAREPGGVGFVDRLRLIALESLF